MSKLMSPPPGSPAAAQVRQRRGYKTDCVNVGSPSDLEEPDGNRQRTAGPAATELQESGRSDRRERAVEATDESVDGAGAGGRNGYAPGLREERPGRKAGRQPPQRKKQKDHEG